MLEDSKSNDHLFSIYENYRRVDGLTLYPVICERRKKAAAAAILSEHARNNTSEFCVLILGGSLLSLNAGFINAVSYLVSRIYVSHTTGSVTSAAVLLDSNELFGFGALLLLVGCFLLGSFITTLLISDQNFYVGRAYNRVFLIGSGILLVAAIVQIVFHESSAYCYFSSCACGMQNAMTTKYSGRYALFSSYLNTAFFGVIFMTMTMFVQRLENDSHDGVSDRHRHIAGQDMQEQGGPGMETEAASAATAVLLHRRISRSPHLQQFATILFYRQFPPLLRYWSVVYTLHIHCQR